MRYRLLFPTSPDLWRRLIVAAAAFGLGLTLAGCSSNRRTEAPSWVHANPPVPVPNRQAAYEPAPGDPIKDAPIEPGRPHAVPDDPREPFSPNYGGPRTRPPVIVSDTAADARDPDPEPEPVNRRVSDASRAYFRRTAALAAAE